jgi:hypothetical protein
VSTDNNPLCRFALGPNCSDDIFALPAREQEIYELSVSEYLKNRNAATDDGQYQSQWRKKPVEDDGS